MASQGAMAVMPGTCGKLMASPGVAVAASHAITIHEPLRVNNVTLADGSTAFSSNGSPTDCVALAAGGVLGAVAFLLLIPVARLLITWFGPPEFLLLALIGLGWVVLSNLGVI